MCKRDKSGEEYILLLAVYRFDDVKVEPGFFYAAKPLFGVIASPNYRQPKVLRVKLFSPTAGTANYISREAKIKIS